MSTRKSDRGRDRTSAVNETLAGVFLLAGVAAAVLLMHGPVAQPAAYHDFADSRTWLGLPHGLNVLSNLLFLATGWSGLRWVIIRGSVRPPAAWTWVFAGSLLVAAGSSWYHFAPSDRTLLWDRLPMAVAFSAYFAALLAEYVDRRLDKALLYGLMPAGIGAVLYWYSTGDLRPWIMAQGLPILATPVVLLLARPHRAGGSWLWFAFAAYVLAKFAEFADASIYVATSNVVSGHSLKHLLAALGVFFFVQRLKALYPRERGSPVRNARD